MCPTPHFQFTPDTPNPLSSQIHLFLKNNLSLVIINYMLMGVGPSTGVWANLLCGHIPKEKVTDFLSSCKLAKSSF